MNKNCSRCKIEKPLDSFSKDKYHSLGYKSACKKCTAGDFRSWREKNLDKAKRSDRINHYMRSYGLTFEQANDLVNDRTGICKICKNIKPLIVDHCHTSGDIRGLICSACNSVLGYAKDNTNTLKEAIKYLEEFYVI